MARQNDADGVGSGSIPPVPPPIASFAHPPASAAPDVRRPVVSANLAPPSASRATTMRGGTTRFELPADFSARRDRRPGLLTRTIQWLLVDQPGWVTSMLLHIAVLLILAMLFVPLPETMHRLTLSFSKPAEDAGLTELALEPEAAGEEPEIEPEPEPVPEPVSEPVPELDTPEPEFEVEAPIVAEVSLPVEPNASRRAATAADAQAALAQLTGIGDRGGRRGLAEGLGATAESEAAVDKALVWIAAHQRPDGAWNFALQGCNCTGCNDLGVPSAVNGATGLALLPFLGAGQTHEKGYHRKQVERGLLYLIKAQSKDGGFYEPVGRMYSHGIVSLALCEALAMSTTDPGDGQGRYRNQPKLRRAAQRSIDYIVKTQHSGGGWRYRPNQPGDTSVVGWQAMALQSAKLAGLKVPRRTLDQTSRFLDSVQAGQYGGHYGYQSSQTRPGTSAVGLLCRIYQGWKRGHPGILEGAEYLNTLGPSANNVYFNYYATQVMHQYQGPIWEAWNPMLRDYLVEMQSTAGHESGSWFFTDDFGSATGGRLYITAMSTMTLEVYYRHMSVYRIPTADF